MSSVRSVPALVVTRTVSPLSQTLATLRTSGSMAAKSASMPPPIIISGIHWVSATMRVPAAQASLTAWVWVIETLTGPNTTSAAFMASATGAGGSPESVFTTEVIMTMGSAPAAASAVTSASAMAKSCAMSVTISAFSPGCTSAQIRTSLAAPFAIKACFMVAPFPVPIGRDHAMLAKSGEGK